MRKLFAVICASLIVASCVTDPVPKGYTGPTAHIVDTSAPRGGMSIDLFYLSKYNGKDVDNSERATSQASYGMGAAISTQVIGREVPVQEATFTITAGTHYAMPILSMTNRDYAIEQTMTFTPQAGHTYVVKGKLGDDYCAVWLEDSATGEVIGTKKEYNGPSYHDDMTGKIVTKPAKAQ